MKPLKLLSLCGLLALSLAACNDNDKKAENSPATTTGSTDTAPSKSAVQPHEAEHACGGPCDWRRSYDHTVWSEPPALKAVRDDRRTDRLVHGYPAPDTPRVLLAAFDPALHSLRRH